MFTKQDLLNLRGVVAQAKAEGIAQCMTLVVLHNKLIEAYESFDKPKGTDVSDTKGSD